MTKVCAEYNGLLDAAWECDLAQRRFPEDSADHQRARAILTELAKRCRTAATVFGIDPTLATEPYGTGRFRSIDLLTEMARQARALLRHACSDRDLDRWPRQDRWDEVEALFARAEQIAKPIVDVVPRRDHFTEVGSQRISRERLACNARSLAEAAGDIRAACGSALVGLPHTDPLVGYLTGLAGQVEGYAAVLQAEHDKNVTALNAATGLAD